MQKYVGQAGANFYIQSHGHNAGRPLREPIRNCFAVWTKTPNAFAIVECLYYSKSFRYFILGSVIPFIRLYEIRPFLESEFSKSYQLEYIRELQKVVELETHYLNTLKKIKLFKIAVAQSIIKKSTKS